ncbi:hypothetical protein FACS189494_10930 [Spirochaetia bacterium]|nr:hypothetical protein FACS189494_10930 [Spirochaetia bacterium]
MAVSDLKTPDAKQVITVDVDKCDNCHACITACPTKICIDGSGEKINVLDKLCLGCGNCIAACSKGARSYNDDTDEFFADLAAGKNIVAIVAPAIATVFDDVYKFNGYLKSLKVKAVFDVSFGAELTVKSYLEHAKKNKPPIIIAQPCAALVRYCEIYKPELLKYLAPAHSPMLHTAAMIKNFFPRYKDCKIAAISPCAAKTSEFRETGLVQYNVTMLKLKQKLEKEHIRVGSFPSVEYDGPQAERAVLFSTPGGLRDTIAREAPSVVPKIRKVEGPGIVYNYLNEIPEMLREGVAPFIVDCLNCEAGCNGGPGTGNNGQPVDRLEAKITKRSDIQIAKNKKTLFGARLKKALKKYWREGIYKRTYKNHGARINQIQIPTDSELDTIYKSMHKFAPKDFYNCSACGYGNCKSMAIAIFNNHNKKEHCHYYLKSRIEEDQRVKAGAIEMANHLVFEIEKSKETLNKLHDLVSKYITVTQEQDSMIEKVSKKMQVVIEQIHTISATAEQKRQGFEGLGTSTAQAKKDMQALLSSFTQVEATTKEIAGIADVIEDVATSTNLLAMNAAIEAAHAGESGRGFAVVASEVRSLATATSENANVISYNIKNIIKQISASLELSNKADAVMGRMINGVDVAESSFGEIVQSQAGVSAQTGELTQDLTTMNETSESLRASSKEIMEALDIINNLILSLDNAADNAKSGGPGPSLGIL